MSRAKTKQRPAQFRTRKGARFPKAANIQAVGDALLQVYEAEGELKPSRYIEIAQDAEHPFHPTLEWDDVKASHQYRLWQARTVLNSIEVIVMGSGKDADAVAQSVPVFFNVPEAKGEGRYRTLDDVIQHPEEMAAVIHALMEKRDALEVRIQHAKRRIETSPDEAIRARAVSLAVALESLAACKLALETTVH
jgi:hypothetical protein